MKEIIEYYEGYDEDGRLTRDNYHRTEFLLTLRFLEPYMIPGSRILDAGAGAGRYSLHFAEEGHRVTALDITPKHIKLIQDKAMNQHLESRISARLGNVMDMKDFEDDSFDVVLCMGPFYHLGSLEEWTICMRECLRVLKPGGTIAVAYVNRAGAYLYKIKRNPETLIQQSPNTVLGTDGYLEDGCFFSATPTEMEGFMSQFSIHKMEHVAADGISAIMQDVVNQMNSDQFDKWQEYLYLTNSRPEHLGTSMHNLFIAKK